MKILQDFAAHRASEDAIAQLDVRLGLAAGDVKHQTGDIFGIPVIEAVRLQSAARPNEILCSDLVRVLSQGRGGFDFEAAGALELKGLPSPVQAFRVRAADPGAASARLEALRHSTTPVRAARAPRATIALAAAMALAVALVLVDAGATSVAPTANATLPTTE